MPAIYGHVPHSRQDGKPTTTGGAHERKDECGAMVTEQFLQRNLSEAGRATAALTKAFEAIH